MSSGLRALIDSYRPRFSNELRTEWAVALIYRPLSFLVTPLFLALGWHPTAISLLGLGVALALPLLAWQGQAASLIGLLAVLFCVLDCVDGNVARLSGRISRLGAYVDFFTDLVYRVALYAAIGLLFDAGSPGYGLAAGLAAAWLALAARASRLYLEADTTGPAQASAPDRRLSAGQRLVAFISGLDHLTPLLLLLCAPLDWLAGLLAYLLVYSLIDLAATQLQARSRLA
jgi:phosphatidylglycerophosphate synthase